MLVNYHHPYRYIYLTFISLITPTCLIKYFRYISSMSVDVFTLSWFVVFALVMLIAFLANIIIILAILRDKSMHTSTYFYIINVNIADILLVLSCLPERLAAAFGSTDGFHLGMFTCEYNFYLYRYQNLLS
jgi:hypocretin (orexin) receptor 2